MRNLQNDIDERYADNLEAELKQLRAELRECTDALNLAEQRFEGEKDALRQTISEVCAERDALAAWRDAVPMDDIRFIAQEGQLQSWYEIKALNNWLASLDGAQ
jgi:chromosome segregation ATPase